MATTTKTPWGADETTIAYSDCKTIVMVIRCAIEMKCPRMKRSWIGERGCGTWIRTWKGSLA